MCLPAAIALASSVGRICVVAVSKKMWLAGLAISLSRSVVQRSPPCRSANAFTLSGVRPTSTGSSMTREPSAIVTPPWARIASTERIRCWFTPMRPLRHACSLRRRRNQTRLSIEPDILETEAVVNAVDLLDIALDVGLQAGSRAVPQDHRPRAVGQELAVDLPHDLAALVGVGLGRLHVEQLLDLGIAVAGIVALRLAGEVLVEVLIGIVDAVAGGVEADRIGLAADLGEPLRGLDDVDLGIDPDPLELAGEDHGGVLVDGDAAGGHLERQVLVGPITQLLHDGAGFLAVLLHIGAVARHARQFVRRQAPEAALGRLHGAALVGLA